MSYKSYSYLTNCEPLKLGDESINCLIYADDLVILSESAAGMQNCLDKLKEYTIEWGLNINRAKTKILIFQRGGVQPKFTFKFGNINIDITDKYKYLGTTLSHSGSFKTNQNLSRKKGLRAAYVIIHNIAKTCRPSTAIRIFEKIVEPILTYNCEITEAFFPDKWDYNKFESKMWETSHDLNKVILSFLRQILGVHKKTTNLGLMAETGKYPICMHIFSRIAKYWMRLTITTKSLLKEAYAANRINFEEGKRSWIKIVRFLTKNVNFEEPINSSKDIDNKIRKFKVLLKSKFQRWWNIQAVVTGKNKLDFYFKYKKQFCFEKYLDNIPKATRMQMTRLRLSSHPFPIETGRYSKKKTKREARKCKICHLDEVGDEEHYLRRCENILITATRNKFIIDVKEKCPALQNFNSNNIFDYCILMNDPKIQLPMAIYAKEIIETYSEIQNLQSKPQDSPKVTRSGRQIKRPEKLDL